MKRLIFSVVVLAVLCTSALVWAGTKDFSGKVSGYSVSIWSGKEIFLFKLDSSVSEGCNTTGRYAINSDSMQYKSIQAAIMSAYHGSSDVLVRANDVCTIIGNSYDVYGVRIGNMPF
ncbi:hypothetical protein KFE80_06045 [bacterium SCSIO 12696]|nr:hypothetical protein KFE80_06045 [bacterium SCSIO 12696]